MTTITGRQLKIEQTELPENIRRVAFTGHRDLKKYPDFSALKLYEAAEKCIRSVIEERMDLEQFAECDITMADLTKIRLALVNTLTGVYHHRIQYPSIKYRRTENGTKGENE